MAPTESPSKGRGDASHLGVVQSVSFPSLVRKKNKLAPLVSVTDAALRPSNDGAARASSFSPASPTAFGLSFRLRGKYSIQNKALKKDGRKSASVSADRVIAVKRGNCTPSASVHGDMTLRREKKDVHLARRIKYFRLSISRGLTFRRKKSHVITSSKSFEDIPCVVSQSPQRRRFQSADFLSDEIPGPRQLIHSAPHKELSVKNDDNVVSDDDDPFLTYAVSNKWAGVSGSGSSAHQDDSTSHSRQKLSTGGWGGWGDDDSDDTTPHINSVTGPTTPKSMKAPTATQQQLEGTSRMKQTAVPPEASRQLVGKTQSLGSSTAVPLAAPEKARSPLACSSTPTLSLRKQKETFASVDADFSAQGKGTWSTAEKTKTVWDCQPALKPSQQNKEETFESDDDNFSARAKGTWSNSWRGAGGEDSACDGGFSHSEPEDTHGEPSGVSDWAGWGTDSDDDGAVDTTRRPPPRTNIYDNYPEERDLKRSDAAASTDTFWSEAPRDGQCTALPSSQQVPPPATGEQDRLSVSKTSARRQPPSSGSVSGGRPVEAFSRRRASSARGWGECDEEDSDDSTSQCIRSKQAPPNAQRELSNTSSVPIVTSAAPPKPPAALCKTTTYGSAASQEKRRSLTAHKTAPKESQQKQKEETFESDDDDFGAHGKSGWSPAWQGACSGEGDASHSDVDDTHGDKSGVSDWAGWGTDSDGDGDIGTGARPSGNSFT